jgi:membrane dipeptidase
VHETTFGKRAGPWPVELAAAALHADSLVWDQHGCLPLRPDEDAIDLLELYAAGGADVVSINVGMDVTPPREALQIVAAFRRALEARSERYLVAGDIADVHQAKRTGRLAVVFDLEGTEPLEGDVSTLETFHGLGVRTVLIAYNRRNRAGGGCHDDPEVGLTPYGRDIVRELNRLGIVVDATHCSPRTTFDLFEVSLQPVVFSHSVPAGVHRHARNVTDAQMRACADTGGVVGINGLGIFLGDKNATTEALVRAIDYAVGVVGVDHVGLGLDYVFDQGELNAALEQHPEVFPAEGGYADSLPIRFVSPLRLPEVTAALLGRGYPEAAVRAILGDNFLRVASQVWR